MNKQLIIGVIVADSEEYRPFAEICEQYSPEPYSVLGKQGIGFKLGDNVLVRAVLCGVGKVNAAAVCSALISGGCDVMLNYGMSGGISGVRRGQTVLADRFLEHDFDLTPLGYKPCEKPGQKYIYDADPRLVNIFKGTLEDLSSGTAVCGDRFVCSDEDRLFLKDTFDAVSCDMETAAIASVCDMADVPFAALRRISDDAGDDAGEAYREMNMGGNGLLSELFLKCLIAVAVRFGGAI